VLAVATREDLKVGALVQAIAHRADVRREDGRSCRYLFIHGTYRSFNMLSICIAIHTQGFLDSDRKRLDRTDIMHP
jgi:hypothetical protein